MTLFVSGRSLKIATGIVLGGILVYSAVIGDTARPWSEPRTYHVPTFEPPVLTPLPDYSAIQKALDPPSPFPNDGGLQTIVPVRPPPFDQLQPPTFPVMPDPTRPPQERHARP